MTIQLKGCLWRWKKSDQAGFAADGIGPMSYSLTLFQALATAAGYDPHIGPGSVCTSECVIPFAGKPKNVTSVVLIANGIAFGVSDLYYFPLEWPWDVASFVS